MKKPLKIIGAILAVLIILFVLSVVVLVTLVNPNRYKDRISQVVYQQTGRELTIAGDINWSFFPWIGIKVSDVTLGNAPQFKDRTFAKVGEAGIGIRLLPLVYGRIEAGKLILRDLSLHLIKNKQGRTNWQDLVDRSKSKPKKITPVPSTQPISKKVTLVSISGIDVRNANIFWNNEQIGQTAKIQNFQLQSSNITLRRAFNVNSSFDFQTTKPDYSGSLNLRSKIIFNPDRNYYGLESLKLASRIKSPNMKDSINIKYTADVDLDLKAQTFAMKNLNTQIADLNINGEIEGNKILNTPSFTGNLDIPTFNPQRLLKSLGKDIQVEDYRALQKASAKFTFQASPDVIKIPSLQITFDQSVLQGNISRIDVDHKFMNFNLALNQINLNRYELKGTSTGAGTKYNSKSTVQNSPSAFNKWVINGDLKVNQFTLKKFNFDQLSMRMNADKGLIALSPIKADFYRGALNANATINMRDRVPQMYVNADLNNTQLDPLMTDFSGTRSRIDGIANLSARLSSNGNNAVAILRNLNGSGKVAVRNGELRGFNVNYLLQFIDILSTKQFSLQQAKTGDTEFANLTGTFNIRNGLLSNNDLVVNALNYRITGTGTANLVDQTLNYLLKAMKVKTVIENGKQVEKISPMFVPIKVSGTFSKPRYSPDVGDIAREATEQYGKKIVEKITTGEGVKDIGKQIKEGIGKLLQ
jgi:AsmA protein